MSAPPSPKPLAEEPLLGGCLCEVARIARVPGVHQSSFVRLLKRATERALKQSAQPDGRNISAGALTMDYFDPIVRAAKTLRIALQKLQGEHIRAGEAARSMAASHFISEALLVRADLDFVEPIGPFIDSLNLELVIEVAEMAGARAKFWLSKSGRKKGTGSAPFDMFVVALLVASEQTAGRLTLYKTAYKDERWTGSLLQAVRHLRPLLPESNFYPAGELGYSLHSVYQRWRSETGKLRRKKQ
jgi:hypothetical protein